MTWNTLSSRRQGNHRLPVNTISIWSNGYIAISSIADQLSPFVEILYDAETSRLAIRSASASKDNFQVRHLELQNSFIIRAKGALRAHGIFQAVAGKRFQVERDNDLFIINLNQSWLSQ